MFWIQRLSKTCLCRLSCNAWLWVFDAAGRILTRRNAVNVFTTCGRDKKFSTNCFSKLAVFQRIRFVQRVGRHECWDLRWNKDEIINNNNNKQHTKCRKMQATSLHYRLFCNQASWCSECETVTTRQSVKQYRSKQLPWGIQKARVRRKNKILQVVN